MTMITSIVPASSSNGRESPDCPSTAPAGPRRTLSPGAAKTIQADLVTAKTVKRLSPSVKHKATVGLE